MTAWPRRVGGALLAGALATGVARPDELALDTQVHAADEAPAPDQKAPNASAPEGSEISPPARRSLAESIDEAVARFIRERTPCGLAGDDIPCFPAAVELEAPEYSVKDLLRDMQGDGLPVPPSVPTHGEIIQGGANPRPVSGGVGAGPDLGCKTKQLFRKLTGRGRTYYVYRVWDATGERGMIREQPLDADEFAGAPRFQYELLGRFGDECEAIKTYRKVGHEARVRQGEAPPDSDSTSTP